MYGIWCEVWGGVTGSREGWMRDDQGILEFEDEEIAALAAAAAQEGRSKSPTANFRYTVRER